MLNKVVIGVDGSPTSRAALRWLARNVDAEVHTVFAISPLVELVKAGIQVDSTAEHAEAHHNLSGAWVAESGVAPERLHSHVIEDSPPRGLLEVAHSVRAEAVVIGAHGDGQVGGLVGSNTGRLVHTSDLPIIVVPSAAAEPGFEPGGPVVVAISGDLERDRRLVAWARQFSPVQHSLRLVHAVAPHRIGNLSFTQMRGTIEAGAVQYMTELLGDVNPDDDAVVVYEDPVSALANSSADAPLVVIGSHHSTRIGGFLTGAISQHLPAVSPCPVALIPLT